MISSTYKNYEETKIHNVIIMILTINLMPKMIKSKYGFKISKKIKNVWKLNNNYKNNSS